ATDAMSVVVFFFFFSSRRRHTRFSRDWSSDVCSSDLTYVRETDELVHLSFTSGAGCQPADGSTANTLVGTAEHPFWSLTRDKWEIGRASCRERGSISVGAGSWKEKSREKI